ncbi:MAG: transposase [Candidatus Vogelbacteria bacterium]|nr:transposase [Candidatus Vogelbacteria bacterium]
MRRVPIVAGEIYHVYNRGVEKRKIVLNDKDRLRFIFSLSVFNDEAPTVHNMYRMFEVGLRPNKGKKLVEILCFTLMNNHYHLLVRPITDRGLTEFIRKLGTGYTNYFNLKYRRVGPLFQGKYKAVQVQTEQQLRYLPFYIHLNPLEAIKKDWFSDGLSKDELRSAQRLLDSFEWSSHLDYLGQKNFPDVSDRTFLTKILGKPEEYRREVFHWLKREGEGDSGNDFMRWVKSDFTHFLHPLSSDFTQCQESFSSKVASTS